jgi:hypothetical protein
MEEAAGDKTMNHKKFKTVCLNRSRGYDEDTFRCSYHGQLVTRQCCLECEERRNETEEQKIQREINLNKKLIGYHSREIEKAKGANIQLTAKKLLLQFEKEKVEQ